MLLWLVTIGRTSATAHLYHCNRARSRMQGIGCSQPVPHGMAGRGGQKLSNVAVGTIFGGGAVALASLTYVYVQRNTGVVCTFPSALPGYRAAPAQACGMHLFLHATSWKLINKLLAQHHKQVKWMPSSPPPLPSAEWLPRRRRLASIGWYPRAGRQHRLQGHRARHIQGQPLHSVPGGEAPRRGGVPRSSVGQARSGQVVTGEACLRLQSSRISAFTNSGLREAVQQMPPSTRPFSSPQAHPCAPPAPHQPRSFSCHAHAGSRSATGPARAVQHAAGVLSATLLAATLTAVPCVAPPPAAAEIRNPNAQIARSAEAALRRATPAFNADVKSVQKKLEDVQSLLRIPQRKPWGGMAKDVAQAQVRAGTLFASGTMPLCIDGSDWQAEERSERIFDVLHYMLDNGVQ
jgi:hypothetical protein